jgi:hypothetical protein
MGAVVGAEVAGAVVDAVAGSVVPSQGGALVLGEAAGHTQRTNGVLALVGALLSFVIYDIGMWQLLFNDV